jgi:hypothetical protein
LTRAFYVDAALVGCGHVSGLLMRHGWPLALMLCADQVPVNSPHSDNAMAHVGCPDRRIDRLCITCCSPSHLHITPNAQRDSRSRRKRDGFLVALAPGHHSPRHSGELAAPRTETGGDPALSSANAFCGAGRSVRNLSRAQEFPRWSPQQQSPIKSPARVPETPPVLPHTRAGFSF